MKGSSLGSYIRYLRLQHGMTQAQLAQKMGVTDKAVSKWERDRSYPDITLFPKLAELLGVTVDDLFEDQADGGHPSRLLQIFEMSHDIRTPLHIILGCVGMAELHHEDTELLMRYLDSIRTSGEYLLNSIDRVMEVTRQEAGRPAGTADAVSGGGKDPEPAPGPDPDPTPSAGRMSIRNTLQKFDFTGRRILVAEDIRMNREIAAEILKMTGAETAFAEDGKVCADMVAAAPAGFYDVILMDIQMPVMDGLEATRRIRQLADAEKAAVPIIALSASVYEKDRRAAFDAGMDAFEEKPIYIESLFRTMQQLFER